MKYAVIASADWAYDLRKRFPKGEILEFKSFVDEYAAVDAGIADAACGFINHNEQIKASFPDLAFIKEPLEILIVPLPSDDPSDDIVPFSELFGCPFP